jgi:hypothetical protein
LRKKAKRIATDESAKKWLYYMGIAYAALLRNGPAAEKVILASAEQARERPYFEKLLAYMRTTLASRTVDPACVDVK